MARAVSERLGVLWATRPVFSALIAGLAAFVVYEVSQEPGHQIYNTYVWLADAFLHGRLDMPEAPLWLDWIWFEGRKYSHQGPLPAVLLMPFVALFGLGFEQRQVAALLGGGVAMAAWSLATRIGLTGWRRVAGWAFPVLGTSIWFEAKTGHTWGLAALASALLLLLALNEYFGKRRLWLVGMFVGLASLSRPPAILALAGFALAVRRPRKLVSLAAGAAGPVLVLVGYNWARFGTLTGRSQELHYLRDSFRNLRPPGLFSLAHIPFNVYSWLFLGPRFHAHFPFVELNGTGTAFTITSPAFVAAFGARRERWMWISAVATVGPAALYYANGFTQFGMRYLIDIVPFLAALVFIALKDDRAPGYAVLLAASIAFNAYAVAYTTVFGLSPP